MLRSLFKTSAAFTMLRLNQLGCCLIHNPHPEWKLAFFTIFNVETWYAIGRGYLYNLSGYQVVSFSTQNLGLNSGSFRKISVFRPTQSLVNANIKVRWARNKLLLQLYECLSAKGSVAAVKSAILIKQISVSIETNSTSSTSSIIKRTACGSNLDFLWLKSTQ